jgi:hypothetical protein
LLSLNARMSKKNADKFFLTSTLLALFWKKNVSRLINLSNYEVLNAWNNLYETWYVYHSTWPLISTYFINPSHQFVCLRVYAYPRIVARQRLGKNPPVVAKQRLGKNVTAATHAAIEDLFGRIVFCAVPVVSKKVGD